MEAVTCNGEQVDASTCLTTTTEHTRRSTIPSPSLMPSRKRQIWRRKTIRWSWSPQITRMFLRSVVTPLGNRLYLVSIYIYIYIYIYICAYACACMCVFSTILTEVLGPQGSPLTSGPLRLRLPAQRQSRGRCWTGRGGGAGGILGMGIVSISTWC